MKRKVKHIFNILGINTEKLLMYSLKKVKQRNGWDDIFSRLERYVPDISGQQVSEESNNFILFKRRLMHVFQFNLMNKLLGNILNLTPGGKIIVVDIGDSAGTHMLYLKKSNPDKDIQTISVNLCQQEIDIIKSKGLEAILCRAEDLDLKDLSIAFYVSFEMVEHLHNPSIFFKKLATKNNSDYMIITVPYRRVSRVGLHKLRSMISQGGIKPGEQVTAEEEHIFELSPEDWELLILHSGWKVIERKIHYQYPNHFPYNIILRYVWRKLDYEGFLGLILKRETRYMDIYHDWEE